MVASPAKGSFLVFFIAAEIMWYGDVLRRGIEERWRGTARLNAYVVLPTVRRDRVIAQSTSPGVLSHSLQQDLIEACSLFVLA